MSLPSAGIAVAAFLALLLGLVLVLVGGSMRRRRGLGSGRTVSLDRVTLTSRRLGLTGRPDRLIRSGCTLVIEEWKSARHVRDTHRAQMGVYFLLAEDCYGIRPSHGFLVTGDGARRRIDNTPELRAWVLGVAGQIRAARVVVNRPMAVDPSPGQCRSCGQVANCGQARA